MAVSGAACARGRYIASPGAASSVRRTSPTTPTIVTHVWPLLAETRAPIGSRFGKKCRAIESLMTPTGVPSALS